jgi:hypothetical protein
MATIRAPNHSIPCMIPLGDDGLAKVAGWFLSIRFKLKENSIHVEEKVFHDNGDLSHTVLQVSCRIDDGRVWFLLLRSSMSSKSKTFLPILLVFNAFVLLKYNFPFFSPLVRDLHIKCHPSTSCQNQYLQNPPFKRTHLTAL